MLKFILILILSVSFSSCIKEKESTPSYDCISNCLVLNGHFKDTKARNVKDIDIEAILAEGDYLNFKELKKWNTRTDSTSYFKLSILTADDFRNDKSSKLIRLTASKQHYFSKYFTFYPSSQFLQNSDTISIYNTSLQPIGYVRVHLNTASKLDEINLYFQHNGSSILENGSAYISLMPKSQIDTSFVVEVNSDINFQISCKYKKDQIEYFKSIHDVAIVPHKFTIPLDIEL